MEHVGSPTVSHKTLETIYFLMDNLVNHSIFGNFLPGHGRLKLVLCQATLYRFER